MSDIAIQVENLSKSYLVGHNSKHRERYTSLRDIVARNARNLASKTLDMFQGKIILQGDEAEEFWALRDISFNLKQGDRVGIIGRNGAGKSTLLKILSRITEPTKGRVTLHGRVASLLEIGTGFHPELTGRENIFLNGSILGMSRREIHGKLEEIISFSEIERFLDTPVKRYSSGMYVRLAFSIAAHLQPDILIIDEALAVGDALFQEKCLGKMEGISKSGRTILFVSHNISALQSFCNKGIVLESSRLTFDGDIKTAIDKYLSSSIKQSASGNNKAGTRIKNLTITDEKNKECQTFINQKTLNLIFHIHNESPIANFGFTVFKNGIPVISSSALDTIERLPILASKLSIKIDVNLFTPGTYVIEGAIWDAYTVYDQNDNIGSFTVATISPQESLGSNYKAPLRIHTGWSINDNNN